MNLTRQSDTILFLNVSRVIALYILCITVLLTRISIFKTIPWRHINSVCRCGKYKQDVVCHIFHDKRPASVLDHITCVLPLVFSFYLLQIWLFHSIINQFQRTEEVSFMRSIFHNFYLDDCSVSIWLNEMTLTVKRVCFARF